jgi:LPS sulfotransferase NodH
VANLTREELLDLFAPYFQRGHERIREICGELQLSRRGGFRTPEKILIILFASRAGSNFFGQLLSSTGWFREIGESFNPRQLTAIRDRYGLADHHQAAQWMIDNRGTESAFGIKAGFYVLTAAVEIGFLPEVIDRAQFVLLRRRDRVAQAVSLVKGKLSGRMHSRQPLGRELTDDDYHAEAIAEQVERITAREAEYEELVRRLGKTAPIVYYEDICASPKKHVEEVCALIGLAMPDEYEPKVRLSILRDELSARWVERFRTERGFAE